MARVILQGVKEFDAAMKRMTEKADAASAEFVRAGGALIAKNAKREFTTVAVHTKSGARKVLKKGEKMGKGFKIERRGMHLSGDRPHIRSGNLSRSIKVHAARTGYGRWESATYPTMKYGRRVELGFHGSDSAGRHYDQPPYPYLEPGFRKSLPEIRELAGRIWGESIL